jgi:hypothetical protein
MNNHLAGFIKRANQYGLNEQDAFSIYKQSQAPSATIPNAGHVAGYDYDPAKGYTKKTPNPYYARPENNVYNATANGGPGKLTL